MTETDNFTIDLTVPDEDNLANALHKTCSSMFEKSELVDCTISCSDGHLQAHRLVLASASTYLCNLLTSTPLPTPCSHPILFLRNSSLADARCAMEYIYTGKTQTSKNRLSALLEVSQELGCISLLKSIENAIQNCGIETFRRLAKTSCAKITNGKLTSPTIKPEKIDSLPQIISVKQDIFDEDDDYEEPVAEDMSLVTSNNNNNLPVNKKRHAVSSVAMLNNGTNGVLQSRKVPRISNFSTNTGGVKSENQNGSNKSSSTALNLQHDKGESFLYTNEDFAMKPLEHEEDENESGDDEEPEGDQPQPIANINELLKGEIKEEDAPASCPWCMQVFTNLALLQKHIRTHVSNYRPFSCQYCHNTFARSAHLKRHLRTHTGEKPYTCSICQRPFARQDKLKTHLERHLSNAAKPSNAMTISGYPPVSLSQSSGGQVPIKVLLPLGNPASSPPTNKPFHQSTNINSNNRFGIGTPNNNGLSISIASSPSENQRSVLGGLIVTPANMSSSTTITPVLSGGSAISNDPMKRTQPSKQMLLNFLVK